METEKSSKNQTPFLRGRKVILCPRDKNRHLENCYRWINDSDVNYFLAVFAPQTRAGEEEWFDEPNKDNRNIVFAIETFDGKHIGMIGLHNINWKDRTATTGAVIGEKEFWGKGYGTDAKMMLLDFAFNELGLEKINSEAYEFNKRSINYSLGCGYKKEGKRRSQIFRRGRRWNTILLGVLREEWLPIWEEYRKTGKANRRKKK
jgi:RimJ/RimL family protein N-acetyltransferase